MDGDRRNNDWVRTRWWRASRKVQRTQGQHSTKLTDKQRCLWKWGDQTWVYQAIKWD